MLRLVAIFLKKLSTHLKLLEKLCSFNLTATGRKIMQCEVPKIWKHPTRMECCGFDEKAANRLRAMASTNNPR